MVKSSITSDQYKLYKLIWERFIASQMASALLDTVAAQIGAAGYTFKASGFTVKFAGFTVLYEESRDDDKEENSVLPELAERDHLIEDGVKGSQHFTQPPPALYRGFAYQGA